MRAGSEVVARNWRCEFGEVDLVAARPGEVVFCEVKARAGNGFGGPEAAVDARKQARVRRIAATWLSEHRPGAVTVRFDVAAVVGARIHVITDAF